MNTNEIIETCCNGLWYLASPYSHPYEADMERRYIAACRAAAVLLTAGVDVYSPIAHSRPIAKYGGLSQTDWSLYQHLDEAMIDACRGLIVLTLDGWSASTGVESEIKYCRAAGKPANIWIEGYPDEYQAGMTIEPQHPPITTKDADTIFMKLFIADRQWQPSKSPDLPDHEYTIRQWRPATPDQDDFWRFASLIVRKGAAVMWNARPAIELAIDGKTYVVPAAEVTNKLAVILRMGK